MAQDFLTPNRGHIQNMYTNIQNIYIYFYISLCEALNKIFTTTCTYGSTCTQCRFPQNTLRPKSQIYTNNRDDKHPHPFHIQYTIHVCLPLLIFPRVLQYIQVLTILFVLRTVFISRLQAFIDFNKIFSRALCCKQNKQKLLLTQFCTSVLLHETCDE